MHGSCHISDFQRWQGFGIRKCRHHGPAAHTLPFYGAFYIGLHRYGDALSGEPHILYNGLPAFLQHK
jgi:hypothetical protein